MKKITKIYKCRIYPNKKQRTLFERDIYAHTFVYNKLLEQYEKDYKKNKQQLYEKKYFYVKLQQLENQFPHLKQINQTILIESYHTLLKSIKQYKKGNIEKPQQLEPNRLTKSYIIIHNKQNKIENNRIHIKEYGTIKIQDNRTIQGKIKQYMIKKQNDQWYIIIKCTQVPMKEYPKTHKKVGIDLGILNLMILSNGTTIKPPNIKPTEEKINKLTRKISKQQENGENYQKTRIQLQKAHQHRTNIITDYLHKISTQIVRNYDFIAMETLQIQHLIRNRKNNHNIFNMNWYKLTKMIQYKANLNNKTFIQVPAWYPSTKLCNKCGFKNYNITINVRQWTCPRCHNHNDRDINAALNILNKAEKMNKEREPMGQGG